jgi:Domain of unknown function (DUF4112)
MPPYQPQGIIEPPSGSSGARAGHDRWGVGGRMLGNERLQWLEYLLDEAFRVPGTGFRFGIDGIIGLVPGLGDVIAGILSLLIPIAAWVRGVPYITLIRMLANVCIGLLVGSIPFVGDGFLIFWKANKRNYRLLTRSIEQPHRNTWRDWIYLLSLGVAVAAIFSLPLIALVWVLERAAEWQPV